MSTLRTQKVTPLDGETNLILGDSGDTVTIPAGVTLAGSGASLTALPAANLTGALPAISGASLTALPAANLTGALPAISGAALTGVSGGKLVQFGKAQNTGSVTSTSQTMVDVPGASVTLTGCTTGNILKCTGWITCRGGTANVILHTQFGFRINNTVTLNGTYGMGASPMSANINWLKSPLLYFHTVTAASNTITLCGGINSGYTFAMGGEVNAGTQNYATCQIIIEELEV